MRFAFPAMLAPTLCIPISNPFCADTVTGPAESVNPTGAKKLYLGAGSRMDPSPGAAGRIHIDDIGLYRPEFGAAGNGK